MFRSFSTKYISTEVVEAPVVEKVEEVAEIPGIWKNNIYNKKYLLLTMFPLWIHLYKFEKKNLVRLVLNQLLSMYAIVYYNIYLFCTSV